ncbi:ATP-binding protein [Geothrix alkalitolerans]|uniref:ATP-binding protein n=1 Tax=Geothrix alkalitolerans TaxID=2922724 RepID=UPI0023E030C6|nr:ATP-binding protein [Geothrix alkalitolerans]
MAAPLRPILVALGSEVRALRLIQAGFRLAQARAVPWIAVHVDRGSAQLAEDEEQVQVWFQEAQRLGAERLEVQAPTLAQGLAEATRRTRAQVLLLGRSRQRWPWARLGHATADELQRRGLDVQIEVMDDRRDLGASQEAPVGFGAMLGALSVLAASSGFAWLVPREGGIALALPIYLVAVTFIAHRWGQRLALLATVMSALIYNFLLETPRFSGSPSDWPSRLFFLGMLLAAQGVMGLVVRLRQQAREVHRREVHTASLYLLSQALARCQTPAAVAEMASLHVGRVFKAEAALRFPGPHGWEDPEGGPASPELPPPDLLLPRLEAAARLGDPLEPLCFGRTCCLALAGTHPRDAILQVTPRGEDGLPATSWELLKAFAVQIALALEHVRWLEKAQKAQVETETERMRSTLLGAIGHDLRTPLAAIHGAAGSLLLPGAFPEATRRDLLTMIQEESERLARLLGNLLELTRLEGGSLTARKEWQPLEEVVGSALSHLEPHQDHPPIQVDLPESLPLVPLDAALFEQVLINLVSNARRHAPGGVVELRAWCDPGFVKVEVADRGPGVPQHLRERIFDKFFRLPGAGEGGAGLGLAICRAIVQAHGGTIQASDRPGGGARFLVALPVDGPPPAAPAESP